MNKFILAIACFVAVFATISQDAQSRGVVSGWSASPTLGSSSKSVSGFSTMGDTGTSGAHASTLSSAAHGVGSISGYSLPGTAGGVGSTSLMPYSAPLHLNPNGTLAHGVAPGSISSNGNLGLLSMTPSQSTLASSTPGVGNSYGSVYPAQLASLSRGSGLMQSSSSGMSSIASSGGGGLLARIASYLSNASGPASTNSGIPSSSIATQTPKMGITSKVGLTANKACAGGVGASAHACN